MESTRQRTAKEAFDIIRQGMTLQAERSTEFIHDERGRSDAFGFIIDDAVIDEDIDQLSFGEINDRYLGSVWDEHACQVIELCQQIHDAIEPLDWDYFLGQTASSEGLAD